MGLAELFAIAVGLSMDAFAVSICKGLSLGKTKFKHMLLAGVWFGGFQAMMPAIGYLFGKLFADMVAKYAHWVAFVLLVIIGGNMIKESLDKNVCTECQDAAMDVKTMFLLAVATSIDALAVGVSFAFLEIGALIIPAVIFIGCITFICAGLGVKIGSIFGAKYKSKAELAGGIVLIAIGLKTLLEGLGIL